jgi:hypothetical protein
MRAWTALVASVLLVTLVLRLPAAGAQPPDDFDDLDNPDVSLIIVGDFDPDRLRISTDKAQYAIDEPIRFCYTVPAPGEIAVIDSLANGQRTTLLAGFDDGRGDCITGTVTPPAGRECLRIRYFFADGGSWSRQTCFDVLGAPAASGPPPPPTGMGGRAIDWGYSPGEHRGSTGQRYAYTCPPNGTLGAVWGTDVYTDDSSLCTAAVHAGLIALAGGGPVTIEIVAGQSAYRGSTRNGVTSRDYGSWGGSFRFVGGAAPPPAAGMMGTVGQYLRVSVGSAGTATLSWPSTPGGSGEWVSVVPAGSPDTRYDSGRWRYTADPPAGSFTVMGLPAGEYEARLYRDSGYTVIDRVRFRVP